MIGNECGFKICIPELWGLPSHEIGGLIFPPKFGGKSVHNLAQIQSTVDFGREYLWNGSRYEQSENGSTGL